MIRFKRFHFHLKQLEFILVILLILLVWWSAEVCANLCSLLSFLLLLVNLFAKSSTWLASETKLRVYGEQHFDKLPPFRLLSDGWYWLTCSVLFSWRSEVRSEFALWECAELCAQTSELWHQFALSLFAIARATLFARSRFSSLSLGHNYSPARQTQNTNSLFLCKLTLANSAPRFVLANVLSYWSSPPKGNKNNTPNQYRLDLHLFSPLHCLSFSRVPPTSCLCVRLWRKSLNAPRSNRIF